MVAIRTVANLVSLHLASAEGRGASAADRRWDAAYGTVARARCAACEAFRGRPVQPGRRTFLKEAIVWRSSDAHQLFCHTCENLPIDASACHAFQSENLVGAFPARANQCFVGLRGLKPPLEEPDSFPPIFAAFEGGLGLFVCSCNKIWG